MYVCLCKGITDQDIKQEVMNGAQHLKDIVKNLGLARDCAQCVEVARDVFDNAWQSFQSVTFIDATTMKSSAA